MNELIALQMDEYSAEIRIQEAQAELNRLYDAFSAKHGLINDRANRLALPISLTQQSVVFRFTRTLLLI